MSDIHLPGGLPANVLMKLNKRKLTYSAHPVKLTEVQGCRFYPGVFLQGKRLYLIVVTDEQDCIPVKGWYDVPDQGYVAWVEDFRCIARSRWKQESGGPVQAFIFEAHEGEPPVEATMPITQH